MQSIALAFMLLFVLFFDPKDGGNDLQWTTRCYFLDERIHENSSFKITCHFACVQTVRLGAHTLCNSWDRDNVFNCPTITTT